MPHKWFDKLSRLIEWWNNFWFDGQYTLHLWYLNAGGPWQLCLAVFFRKTYLWEKNKKIWSKMMPKLGFSFILKNFVIDFCWKHTNIMSIDIGIYFIVQISYLGKFLVLSYSRTGFQAVRLEVSLITYISWWNE